MFVDNVTEGQYAVQKHEGAKINPQSTEAAKEQERKRCPCRDSLGTIVLVTMGPIIPYPRQIKQNELSSTVGVKSRRTEHHCHSHRSSTLGW